MNMKRYNNFWKEEQRKITEYASTVAFWIQNIVDRMENRPNPLGNLVKALALEANENKVCFDQFERTLLCHDCSDIYKTAQYVSRNHMEKIL